MKKDISIIFIIIVFITLIFSVSKDIKDKVEVLSKSNQYSSPLVRLPYKDKIDKNLASKSQE